MKVDGPKGLTGPKAAKDVKKAGRSGGTGFASALSGAGGNEDDQADCVSSLAGGVAGLSGLDALLALQSVDTATDKPDDGKARQWAGSILDELDELRMALLAGIIPRERLRQLADRLEERGRNAQDPRLKEVLADVELRARVELAKYGD